MRIDCWASGIGFVELHGRGSDYGLGRMGEAACLFLVGEGARWTRRRHTAGRHIRTVTGRHGELSRLWGMHVDHNPSNRITPHFPMFPHTHKPPPNLTHLNKQARSLPVRKDDIVKIVRGNFKDREGKVVTVYRKKWCIYIEKIQKEKTNGMWMRLSRSLID